MSTLVHLALTHARTHTHTHTQMTSTTEPTTGPCPHDGSFASPLFSCTAKRPREESKEAQGLLTAPSEAPSRGATVLTTMTTEATLRERPPPPAFTPARGRVVARRQPLGTTSVVPAGLTAALAADTGVTVLNAAAPHLEQPAPQGPGPLGVGTAARSADTPRLEECNDEASPAPRDPCANPASAAVVLRDSAGKASPKRSASRHRSRLRLRSRFRAPAVRQRPASYSPSPEIRRERQRFVQARIATFNVNGLGDAYMPKLVELVEQCKTNKIILLAVQEHHSVRAAPWDVPLAGGWAFKCSSAQRENDRVIGGCGFLLAPSLAELAPVLTEHTPRIIQLTIEAEMRVHFFCVYAPHAGKSEERHAFFAKLMGCVECIPHGEQVLLLGDWNSIQVPDHNHRYGYTGPMSDAVRAASEEFHEFLALTGLVTTTGHQRNARFHTFIGAPDSDGRRRRVPLDYIVVARPTRSSVVDTRVVAWPIPSDHLLLVMRMTGLWAPRKNRKLSKRQQRLDCSPLYRLAGKAEEFAKEVRRRFGQRLTTTTYADFSKVCGEVANSMLQRERHDRRRDYGQEAAVVAARESFAAQQSEDLHELTTAFRKVADEHRRLRAEDVDRFALGCENAMKNMDSRVAYHFTRQLMARKGGARVMVAGRSEEERKRTIARTCQNQLTNDVGDPTVMYPRHVGIDESRYNTGPFTEKELEKATAFLQRHKATGADGMYSDFLKVPGLYGDLLGLFNDCLATGTTPEQFRLTQFAMLPKPGASHRDPAGWRYIALMSYAAKLYNILLRERLRPVIDPHLRENQNGFRAKRSTLQHVAALQFLMDEARRRQGMQLILTFIDFKNAFPSIRWYAIEASLRAFSVPELLIKAVMSTYFGHRGLVLTPDGETNTFDITAGVLQGDTLAPYLFIVVLNEVMLAAVRNGDGLMLYPKFRDEEKRCHRPEVRITDMAFADDIVLVSETAEAANTFFNNVALHARRVGLVVNDKKTQYVQIGCVSPGDIAIKHADKRIAEVAEYRYLGCWTNTSKEVSVRTGQAWETMRSLKRVFRSDVILRDTKVRLWKALVLPVLTYGMAAHPLTVALKDRLDGTMTRMLRWVNNVAWNAHATLEQLYAGGILPATALIERYRMKLLQRTFASGVRQPLLDAFLFERPDLRVRKSAPRITLNSIIRCSFQRSSATRDELISILKDKDQFNNALAIAVDSAVERREEKLSVQNRKRAANDAFEKSVRENLDVLLPEDVPILNTPLVAIRQERNLALKAARLDGFLHRRSAHVVAHFGVTTAAAAANVAALRSREMITAKIENATRPGEALAALLLRLTQQPHDRYGLTIRVTCPNTHRTLSAVFASAKQDSPVPRQHIRFKALGVVKVLRLRFDSNIETQLIFEPESDDSRAASHAALALL